MTTLDAEIAELLVTLPGETPSQQRQRCARWAALAFARLAAGGVSAFVLARRRDGRPQ